MTAVPYSTDDVLDLQDVIADARIRGIGPGTFSLARAILEAGYRRAAASPTTELAKAGPDGAEASR